MTNLLIFIALYFAALALLSVIARPYRVRLIAVSESLLSDHVNESERQFVSHVTRTAYSVRTSPMLFLIFLQGLLRTSESLDANPDDFEKSHPALTADNRAHELLEMHMASAAAVNPIFGILAYAAKWAFRAKAAAYLRKSKNSAINLDIYEMRSVLA